jgi:PAS domain S-box-containing protein
MNEKSLSAQNLFCLDIVLMSAQAEIRNWLIAQSKPIKPLQSLLLCKETWPLSQEASANNDQWCLTQLSRKFDWQRKISEILRQKHEALVLTNVARQILWVNKGFEQMTGYKAYEAVGKKPNFLQGASTTSNTRRYFREKLAEGKEFSLSITNYRKNGQQYLCQVHIFPLYNSQEQITHFLALEKELS